MNLKKVADPLLGYAETALHNAQKALDEAEPADEEYTDLRDALQKAQDAYDNISGQLNGYQAQLDAGKAQLNSQKADVTTQLRDAITELDKQIPELEKKIASLQTDLDEANRKLENAKNTSTTLPEVTLPIDDALFASCKTVLAAYDPQYNADALPANLAEAKSDLNKMGAMVNSIDRADAAIRQRAADEGLLEQNMTVEQTAAYLDAQYAAMSARIQALEVEIASLQDTLNNTEDEAERADLQAQIDAKRAEQAQDQAVIDGNAARRARVSELSGNLSTLSTAKVALQNATTLLTARQEAETALNDGMQPLQQTLNDTAAALRDQLTKAQKMLLMVGKGGEGKSRIGLILRELFGSSMYTGSLQKVETNRFARADLEYKLLLVDDDMKTADQQHQDSCHAGR